MPITKIAYSSIENERENYINVLRAGQSISDIGWRIYNDASAIPVDGTGGTTNITWSQNTSNPLSGDSDLRLVKDANNRQGEGVSIDFTVSNRHLAKVLQITLDSELISGTFATGDLKFYIIANPNSTNTIIEPVNVNLQLGIANQRIRHIASFQTDISITSYRLCIHVASTSTSAYTVDFNNFKVWEPTQSIGSVITDWQSYTPTFAGIGTSAALTAIDFRWQRVGKNLKIIGRCTITTGATGSGVFTFTLPTGLVPDLGYTSGDGVFVGTLIRGVISESNVFTLLARNDNLIRIGANVSMSSSSHNPLVGSNATTWFGDGNILNLTLEVPILGWGSSVAMSSDTGDSRVVAAKYNNNNAIVGGNATWNVLDFDTHSAYTTSTGVYLVPVSGIYRVTATGSTTTGGEFFYFKRNGVTVANGGQAYTGTAYTNATTLIRCNAGDTITISYALGSTVSIAANNFVSFERISAGSQVIASSERVHCRYTNTNGQSITASTNTLLQYNNRIEDSHGAYSTSDWIYRPPMSGVYLFTVGIAPASNSSNGWASYLFINKSSISSLSDGIQVNPFYNNSGGNGGSNGSIAVRLNSGDTVRIVTNYSNSGTSPITLYNSGEYGSTLTVTRISI